MTRTDEIYKALNNVGGKDQGKMQRSIFKLRRVSICVVVSSCIATNHNACIMTNKKSELESFQSSIEPSLHSTC